MSLILVTHDTDEPALYGGIAAAVACRLGAGFAHLPAQLDTMRFADAVQHVTADGALVGSGLLWWERLSGRSVARATTIDAILAEAEVKAIVVPLHPALTGECGSELARRAGSEKRDVRQVNVVRDGASWRVVVAGLAQGALGKWSRDAFGRLESGTVGRTRSDTRLRIGVVGSERDHRCAYPAGIAALGDAADHLGRSVDITFIDPPSLRPIDVPEILDGIDGVVLPGGADMINVPGQIMMARGTLEAGTPTLGLCLGMQTMTTAALQRALNTNEINLAEADPAAPIKSFIAMGDTPGLDEHRLGDRTIRTEPDLALSAWLGDAPTLRYNHRFRLNPALHPDVLRAGLWASAWDHAGQIVDGVECARHPFYVGLQGHPELLSRPQMPHPVITAFLESAGNRAQKRT